MDRTDNIVPTKGQRTSTIALWIVIGGIVFAALTALVYFNVAFGSVDNFFQFVIKLSLEARYNLIVDARPTWTWSFWIFFWGFLAVLVFVLLVVLYTTLLERKLIGFFQIRQGPNRVGPWGLLQPFADMIKLLVKEDIVPRHADKWLHLIAPLFIFIPTLLAFAVIPFGKGTVELPQEIVSPTFKPYLMEWISETRATELGYDSAGYLEAGIKIEESEEFHKTWWVNAELDHDPVFFAAEPIPDAPVYGIPGIPLERRYQPVGGGIVHEFKQDQPGSEQIIIGTFFRVFDLKTTGRTYDVLEIKFDGVNGHNGVIELGLQGETIDSVEEEYSEMLAGIGPELAWYERYEFGSRSPKVYLENLFSDFADAVAINNRTFGPDSMVPAFGYTGGSRATWRDLYTPDFDRKKIFYIHGAVDRHEKKASLYFFPKNAGENLSAETVDFDTFDWMEAGASFRIRRITDGGYEIEEASGTTHTIASVGDAVGLNIGGNAVTLTLKDTQRYNIYLVGADLGVGILYILAVTSLAVIGIFMAGFGSNNKWSLYGALRSVAQLFSYEVPMTLAVLGPVLLTGSLSMVDIVESQRGVWYVLPQFLAFYTFLVCMTAEINRSPFDLPEAESELVAGYHTEYSGLKFGFFFLAEYANMFVAAALMTTLFFGGWKGPFVIPFIGEFLSSFVWFVAKSVFWLCVFIWFRSTLPRFRIDQMMDYAWKILLPIAMINVILTGWFAFSDVHATGDFTIWKENNWRVVEMYVKPLFFNVYTNYYAIPIITIITVLFVWEIYGNFLDKRKAAAGKEINAGD